MELFDLAVSSGGGNVSTDKILGFVTNRESVNGELEIIASPGNHVVVNAIFGVQSTANIWVDDVKVIDNKLLKNVDSDSWINHGEFSLGAPPSNIVGGNNRDFRGEKVKISFGLYRDFKVSAYEVEGTNYTKITEGAIARAIAKGTAAGTRTINAPAGETIVLNSLYLSTNVRGRYPGFKLTVDNNVIFDGYLLGVSVRGDTEINSTVETEPTFSVGVGLASLVSSNNIPEIRGKSIKIEYPSIPYKIEPIQSTTTPQLVDGMLYSYYRVKDE